MFAYLLPSSLIIMSLMESLTEFLASSVVQIVDRFPMASVIVRSISVLTSLFWLVTVLAAVVPESVAMVLMWPTVMTGVLERSSSGLENIRRSGTTSVVAGMKLS